MISRKLASGTCVAAALGLLAGCGGGSTATTGTAGGGTQSTGNGGSGGGTTIQTIQGIATPQSVAVVTATNTN